MVNDGDNQASKGKGPGRAANQLGKDFSDAKPVDLLDAYGEGTSTNTNQPQSGKGSVEQIQKKPDPGKIDAPGGIDEYRGFVPRLPPGETRINTGAKQPTESTTLGNAQTKTDLGKPVATPTVETQSANLRTGTHGIEQSKPAEARVSTDGSQQGVKLSHVALDGGTMAPSTVQGVEPQAQKNKASVASPGDKVEAGGSTGLHKPEAPLSAVGAAHMPSARKDEATAGSTVNRPAVAESNVAGVPKAAANIQDKGDGRPAVVDVSTGRIGSIGSAGAQSRAELKGEPSSSVLPTAQQRLDSQRSDSHAAGQAKFETAKGDVLGAQGSINLAQRSDGARVTDAKADAGKPLEQLGSKDVTGLKDAKTANVANEVFGQKSDAGQRSETSQSTGIKSETSKADQITKAISDRVSEGPKPLSGADSRLPNSSDAPSGVRQPGTADGGMTGAVRQPLADSGDKVSTGAGTGTGGGGGSGVAADSTRKVDVGMPQGAKTEGPAASNGMGGGSSAPVDRAPHAPFKVEDAQPSGGRGEVAASGKGHTAGDGTRFDAGEIRGNQPGARFDSGEIRGNQPGTRFDTGEVKDGRTGVGSGAKSGDGGGTKGAETGIVKGADVAGPKTGAGGGTGGGGSGGSAGSDGGILGDKRQPPVLPDSLVNQGSKPGKAGEGISTGNSAEESVPFFVPGSLGGKDGGRRQSDQIFGDKTKATEGTGRKPEPGPVPGKAEVNVVGSGAAGIAEVGSVLKNFAQNVLSDAKLGQPGESKVQPGDNKAQPQPQPSDSGGGIAGGLGAAAMSESKSQVGKGSASAPPGDKAAGKVADARQEYSGPGQKTRIIEQSVASDDGLAVDDLELPEVDLLGETEDAEKVEPLSEIEESQEVQLENEMHYELALGLQLYSSIAESPYGAYYYLTREGDTVESVAREIVGEPRTAPLVFSLNKEHILASTEYGVHPFKVGVMVQLPTPRDLKNFFGSQT